MNRCLIYAKGGTSDRCKTNQLKTPNPTNVSFDKAPSENTIVNHVTEYSGMGGWIE